MNRTDAIPHPNDPTRIIPAILPAEPSSRSEAGEPDSGTAGQAESAPLLHELFETTADASPYATALVFGAERAKYAALERRANRFAHLLRARGIGRESRVALWLPRSPDAYAAMLGVLKAGAAYVPIDPDCPPERAAFILSDSNADVLVATEPLAGTQPGFGGVRLLVDADHAAIAAASPVRRSAREAGVGPGDLCYIIYTSGSTGQPKGVMIEHRSAAHLVLTEERLFRVRPHDRVYQGFPLAFDASVEEIWLAFRSGATLIPATPERGRSA